MSMLKTKLVTVTVGVRGYLNHMSRQWNGLEKLALKVV